MTEILKKIFESVNNDNSKNFFVVTLLICLFFTFCNVFPKAWTANEIMYFGEAHSFINPDKYGQNSSYFHSSPHLTIPNLIIGYSMDLFGFDFAKLILGIVIWVSIGLSLTLLSNSLKIKPFFMGLILSIFILKQSFLGHETILDAVEAKTIAYPLVITAIYFAINAKWKISIILFILATSIHFLVGAFWGFSILLLFLLNKFSLKKILIIVPIFILIAISSFYIIYSDIALTIVDTGASQTIKFGNNIGDSLTTVANIYSSFRVPHHVAPFSKNLHHILIWVQGVLSHISLAIIILILLKKSYEKFQVIGKWLIFLNLYIVIAIFISFVDRHTNIYSVLFMFRPSSLIYLLSIMFIFSTFQKIIKEDSVLITSIIALIISLSLYLEPLKNVSKTLFVQLNFQDKKISIESPTLAGGYQYPTFSDINNKDIVEIVEWININTTKDEIVLVEPHIRSFWALEFFTNRKTYVNYKFNPTKKKDIIEWYNRLFIRDSAFSGNCKNFKLISAKYLISKKNSFDLTKCADMVFNNNNFIISKIRLN